MPYRFNPFTGTLDYFKNSGGSGGTSEKIAANLVEGDNIFNSSVLDIFDVTVFDTAGNEIELATTVSGSTVTICSLANINNVLISIQGG